MKKMTIVDSFFSSKFNKFKDLAYTIQFSILNELQRQHIGSNWVITLEQKEISDEDKLIENNFALRAAHGDTEFINSKGEMSFDEKTPALKIDYYYISQSNEDLKGLDQQRYRIIIQMFVDDSKDPKARTNCYNDIVKTVKGVIEATKGFIPGDDNFHEK